MKIISLFLLTLKTTTTAISAVIEPRTVSVRITSSPIQLFAESTNPDIDGLGLSSIHEGAGFNFFFLGTYAETLYLNSNRTITSLDTGVYPAHLGMFADRYLATNLGEGITDFSVNWNNYLYYNRSLHGFYACKNTSDPYGYSAYRYGIMYYTEIAPESCDPIYIHVSHVND